MSAGPEQWPGSDVPPWAEQDDVEIHVPGAPLLTLQVVGVAEAAGVLVTQHCWVLFSSIARKVD